MLASLFSTFLLAVLPIAAAPAESGPPPAAAAWLGRVSPSTPGAFPPPRSFDSSYRITWANLDAAQADIHCVSSEADNTVRTTVKTATTGGARLLYKLDGTGVSVADRRDLHPLRLDQTEERNGKHSAAHVVFSPTGATRLPESSKEGKPGHVRHLDYPGIMDIHSALLHIRSLPLATGDEKTFVVMSATTPYLATIKVVGRGRVKVKTGEYPAIECAVSLQKINKFGELEVYKSLKEAHAWISDDADRIFLKAETQIFIGSVNMELEKIRFTDGAGR